MIGSLARYRAAEAALIHSTNVALTKYAAQNIDLVQDKADPSIYKWLRGCQTPSSRSAWEMPQPNELAEAMSSIHYNSDVGDQLRDITEMLATMMRKVNEIQGTQITQSRQIRALNENFETMNTRLATLEGGMAGEGPATIAPSRSGPTRTLRLPPSGGSIMSAGYTSKSEVLGLVVNSIVEHIVRTSKPLGYETRCPIKKGLLNTMIGALIEPAVGSSDIRVPSTTYPDFVTLARTMNPSGNKMGNGYIMVDSRSLQAALAQCDQSVMYTVDLLIRRLRACARVLPAYFGRAIWATRSPILLDAKINYDPEVLHKSWRQVGDIEVKVPTKAVMVELISMLLDEKSSANTDPESHAEVCIGIALSG